MSAKSFPYPEAAFGTAIGLPRQEMRALRDRVLSKKEWGEAADGTVMLSRKAVEKIGAELLLPDLEKIAAGLLEPPAVPAMNGNGLRSLKVVQIPVNVMLVICADEAGTRFNVDVGRNELFLTGMELQARPHQVHQGLYKLDGPRPRMKGRW